MKTAPSTFTSRQRGLSLLAAASLGTPIALFLALKLFPSMDRLFESVNFHLAVVSVIAACAVGIALIATIAASRSHDPALVFVALGCLALGVLMLGHALTTPGVANMPFNYWVGRLPNVAIAAFALSQAAAVLRPDRAVARFVGRHSILALGIPAAVLGFGTVIIVASPTAGFGGRPLPNEETLTAILRAGSALTLGCVGAIHWRRWRLSGDTISLALSLASLLSVEALLSLRFGRMWHLSWWDYHALLLLGFGSAVAAVVMGFLQTRDKGSMLSGAYVSDPLAHIARGYPEALRTLVAAVEVRDAYTSGHSSRVTETAGRIGQRLGLRPDELRRLVWGAELHDIGKIGIPDHIINKPGSLTSEERCLIEDHPVIGWEIARQAQSLDEVLEVVRWHHERIDGTGYPDRLKGAQIPLAARIVAVADVWDALTSERSYRPAWDPQRALDVMVAGRGSQFDETCLDAFLELMRRQGVVPSKTDREDIPEFGFELSGTATPG